MNSESIRHIAKEFVPKRVSNPATAGDPVLVKSTTGEDAYWLVPLITSDRAYGYVMIDFTEEVLEVSQFGEKVDIDFFKHVPAELLLEIQAKFAGMPLSEPVFSYDQFKFNWAWRIVVGDTEVYIRPGAWYDKSMVAHD